MNRYMEGERDTTMFGSMVADITPSVSIRTAGTVQLDFSVRYMRGPTHVMSFDLRPQVAIELFNMLGATLKLATEHAIKSAILNELKGVAHDDLHLLIALQVIYVILSTDEQSPCQDCEHTEACDKLENLVNAPCLDPYCGTVVNCECVETPDPPKNPCDECDKFDECKAIDSCGVEQFASQAKQDEHVPASDVTPESILKEMMDKCGFVPSTTCNGAGETLPGAGTCSGCDACNPPYMSTVDCASRTNCVGCTHLDVCSGAHVPRTDTDSNQQNIAKEVFLMATAIAYEAQRAFRFTQGQLIPPFKELSNDSQLALVNVIRTVAQHRPLPGEPAVDAIASHLLIETANAALDAIELIANVGLPE